MNRSGFFAAIAALVVFGGAPLAQADSDAACAKGGVCKLGDEIPTTFKTGQVDGAAVWRKDSFALVAFTNSGDKPAFYEVAICGASRIYEARFDSKAKVADKKITSPKGKLSQCDRYELKTGKGLDGFIVEAKGKSFKLYARKDGKASGFDFHLSDRVVPARENAYHFRIE